MAQPGRLELVRVQELLDPLEEGEGRAEGEQHDRHDERPEEALATEAEGVLAGGLPRGRVGRRRASSTWLPVSATEWMLSASIELEPVKRKPTNLATAMPRLASRAAMIARVDPPEDMRPF